MGKQMKQSGTWVVGPESVRMIELGHPWIIADAYTKHWPEGSPGQLVELTDDSGGFVATALLDPGERIVARVLGQERFTLDKAWFRGRFDAALKLRIAHANLGDTDAYRLVNAEGDGLPGLTVDRYADYLMIQLYSRVWRPYLQTIVQVLQELLAPLGIYEKSRPQNTRELESASSAKRYGKLLAGTAAPSPLTVRENGLNLLVNLEMGLNTGLFPDQRDNRRDLMLRANHKRVLNLFAHTGAFSVAAAAAGATLVTSVDASQQYLEWSRANFGANRLNPKRHEFVVGDCLTVLNEMARQGKRYDIILMDPPSFSTTARGRFTTRGGTSDIVAAAISLLETGGLMITSSNHQKVDIADYLKELRRASLQAGAELRVISIAGQPADFPFPVTFPEGRYLKYVTCMKSR